METRRWINQSQPQTLLIAQYLLYLQAVFILLFGGIFSVIGLAFAAAYAGAAYGIANERKWGYGLGLAVTGLALLFYVLAVLRGANVLATGAIGLLFDVARFALLVHPMSREYQRIWFR